MSNELIFTNTEKQMLEFLARGLTNKEIAEQLGYQAGTMRVYLHHLYSKIGVQGKTATVLWYLSEQEKKTRSMNAAEAEPRDLISESFGQLAVRTNLQAALGVMSTFLGAYARTWEVSMRLQGIRVESHDHARRNNSRQLWESLLLGDWPYAKRLYDMGAAPALLVDSSFDCAVLACMLLIGGYSSAADRVIKILPARKPGAHGLKVSEIKLVAVLRDVVETNKPSYLADLHKLINTYSANHTFKHLAMVVAHYAHRLAGDTDRASQCADAIWAEAEIICQHLIEIGERALPISNTLPAPKMNTTKKSTRRTTKQAVQA